MPIDALLLTKIAVTILVVLSLSAVAENVSPRLAGVLSGYPVGSAIALGFYGVEFGAEFAGRCASYNLLTVAAAYPTLGLLPGTLLGFAAATVALALRLLRPGFLLRRQPAASGPG